MAEISTIARPYAKGLYQALEDRHASIEEHKAALEAVEKISKVIAMPEIAQVFGDPKLSSEQIIDLIHSVLPESETPKEVNNLLSVVLKNGRIAAWSSIADDYRQLINNAEGIAEAYIESAFEMSSSEIEDLLKALARHFPNKKLVSHVTINRDLIGGVRIRVGDQVLDGSISARLEQMKTALTA